MPVALGLALVLGGALVGCIGGFGIASIAGEDEAGGASPRRAPGPTEGTPASPTPSATAGPLTIVDDGVLLVPAEVTPGTYRATVPADSQTCYWARLSGTTGAPDDIVANGNAKTGQLVTVTVRPTDKAFESTGCGSWTRVG